MQTELNQIVQNSGESQNFYTKNACVSEKKIFESFVLGQNY